MGEAGMEMAVEDAAVAGMAEAAREAEEREAEVSVEVVTAWVAMGSAMAAEAGLVEHSTVERGAEEEEEETAVAVAWETVEEGWAVAEMEAERPAGEEQGAEA